MKTILLVLSIMVTGCTPALTQWKTVEVPTPIACVKAPIPKPERLTPCSEGVSDSQCVLRSSRDIERLDSALDQNIAIIKACQ